MPGIKIIAVVVGDGGENTTDAFSLFFPSLARFAVNSAVSILELLWVVVVL